MNPPESSSAPPATPPPPIPGNPRVQPGFPPNQEEQDRSNIKLLAVFHFVHAGLMLFGIAFLFMHYAIMSTVFLNGKFVETVQAQEKLHASESTKHFRTEQARQSKPAPSTVLPGYGDESEKETRTNPGASLSPQDNAARAEAREANVEFFENFFKAFIWFYIFAGICLLIALILNALSGIFMLKEKHRMFSLVVAGLNCLNMPLGTILGIFTILVLNRDSVQRLYAPNQASPSSAP